MTLERINYPFLGDPVGPYTHAVKHENTLYLSGLTAFGTKAQSASIEQQALAIFNQIEHIAKIEGCGLHHLIKVTLFVTELEHINKLRQQLFDIYNLKFPASSLIHISSLFDKDLKIEVEAILALNA